MFFAATLLCEYQRILIDLVYARCSDSFSTLNRFPVSTFFRGRKILLDEIRSKFFISVYTKIPLYKDSLWVEIW
jgi:hypothetical protein